MQIFLLILGFDPLVIIQILECFSFLVILLYDFVYLKGVHDVVITYSILFYDTTPVEVDRCRATADLSLSVTGLDGMVGRIVGMFKSCFVNRIESEIERDVSNQTLVAKK